MLREFAETVWREAEAQEKRPLLISIDGRCAAGKTTLAALLQEICGCPVIHMDHFFLRPEQRTESRLRQPGGNVDYERFLHEVLLPLKRDEPFSYRPYDCGRQELSEPIQIEPSQINLIEGSYCCHPALFEHYDVRVFLDVKETEQLKRIRNRNGEAGAKMFQSKWIPLEEQYFSACQVRERCHLIFAT